MFGGECDVSIIAFTLVIPTRQPRPVLVISERAMKITVEVPDDLYRRAKAEAALSGRKLRELVEEGLRLVLEAPRKTRPLTILAGLM
jgi:hypothetical protein